ncbi:MAG: cupin domain-containing protein [Planctomycetaceae bacterium]|nr:cupin domain-containing protein [Planctomycetaceae bacterium]
MKNLFSEIPEQLPGELTQALVNDGALRIERIVSMQHSTPNGQWYDQSEHEWVAVLRGQAHLLFEGDEAPLVMKPGDWISIPPHRRHRVEATAMDQATVWLAVFWEPTESHSSRA